MLRGKSAQNVWSSENRNRKFGRSCPAAKRFAACTGEADTPEIRSSAGKRIRGFIRFDSIHEITLGSARFDTHGIGADQHENGESYPSGSPGSERAHRTDAPETRPAEP